VDLVELAQARAAQPVYPAGVPPDVCELFDKLALRVAGDGWQRYSADALLHRIRWEMTIERGNRAFRCNNNWTSLLARWWLARHPEFVGFFETRDRADDGYRDE
jgi:hypothetical protein